jgi:hypothetical protein
MSLGEMDFRQAENRYRQLRQQLSSGALTKEQFRAELQSLMLQDASGHYWALGADTGKWYVHDGSAWIPGDPFRATPEPEAAPPPVSPPPPQWPQSPPESPEDFDGSTFSSDGDGDSPIGPVIMGIIGIIALCIVGALIFWLWQSIQGDGAADLESKPVVTIAAPQNGAQVNLGDVLVVQSVSADPQGVKYVELWVDGKLMSSAPNPDSEGQSPFAAAQSWTADQPGQHTLNIKAYDTAGVASDPATITISVLGSAPTATTSPTETSTAPTPSPTSSECSNGATFVSDVTVPDDTAFAPGAPIHKVWRIENSGTCPWEAGYVWAFVSGDQMGAPANIQVANAAAGATVDIAADMVAPSTPGSYTGYWQMRNPDGVLFGSRATIVIEVPGEETPTPTSTATAVPDEVTIDFQADRTTIALGECTTISWAVENATAVYYQEGGVSGNDSRLECPGVDTRYTLRVEHPGGTEYRYIDINVTTGAEETEILTSEESEDGTISSADEVETSICMAGDTSERESVRAFFSFDIASLAEKEILSAELDLSDYALTGGAFEWLHPMLIEDVTTYGTTLDASDYDTAASASLASASSEVGLNSPIDVTDRVANWTSTSTTRFQVRARFEAGTNGDGFPDDVSWESEDVTLTVTYIP